jgi:glycerate kinase
MAVSRLMIDAYKRHYTAEQLAAAQKQALADRTSGVQITQVNFQDGGGTGSMISGDPNEIIEITEIALQEMEGDRETGIKPMSAAVNFCTRRFET